MATEGVTLEGQNVIIPSNLQILNCWKCVSSMIMQHTVTSQV